MNRRLLLLLAVPLAFGAWHVASWQSMPPGWSVFRAADQWTVFKLEGEPIVVSDAALPPEAESFHGHRVLGRRVLRKGEGLGELRRALTSALRTPHWNVLARLAPHHGIRAEHDGQRFDLLIDVEARTIEVHDSTGMKVARVSVEPGLRDALERQLP